MELSCSLSRLSGQFDWEVFDRMFDQKKMTVQPKRRLLARP
jgi:hypothetical protein